MHLFITTGTGNDIGNGDRDLEWDREYRTGPGNASGNGDRNQEFRTGNTRQGLGMICTMRTETKNGTRNSGLGIGQRIEDRDQEWRWGPGKGLGMGIWE